jgi:hypothetical protein
VEILGRRTPVNPRTVDAWKVLSAVLEAHGYRASSVWCYNCRPIAGGKAPSLHAYGLAVDIDPAANPYIRTITFSWADTRFTEAMIDDVYRIRTNTGQRVFQWGGRWRTIKDYMHFQIDVSPADLASGIDGSTPPGASLAAEEKTVRYTRKDDRSDEVTELQRILTMLGHDLRFGEPPGGGPGQDGVDGVFGSKTASALAEEQAAAHQAGISLGNEDAGYAGPNTWAWLLRRLSSA